MQIILIVTPLSSLTIKTDSATVDRYGDTPLWYRLMAMDAPYSVSGANYTFYGEVYYGTNASDPDTDSDGLIDGNTRLIRKNTQRDRTWLAANLMHQTFKETLSLQQLLLGYTTYWAPPVEIYAPVSDSPSIVVEKFVGELDDEINATNATDPDTDDDGLPDGWEKYWGLDPNSSVGDNGTASDPDNDGANNSAEYDYGLVGNASGLYLSGLDPFTGDMDNDELPDGDEINATGDNPLGYATHPLVFDSNGDGLPDGWEKC